MATLINQIQIVNLAPATPTAFPHGLNIDGVGLVPDRVEADNGNLRINSADATNVVVENTGGAPASGTVQAEHMHSIERAIPPALADLPVLPFLPQSGGGGGGGTAEFLGTTGADVDVGSAAPPAAGQVLKATDATHATWQPESGGSADALGTTGADVDVGSAAPPAAGQVLKATDATHATWQAVSLTNPLILKTGNGTVTAPAAFASGAIGHGIDGGVGTADVQVDPLASGLAMGWTDSFVGGTAQIKAAGKASFAHGYAKVSGAFASRISAETSGSQAFGAAYGWGANAAVRIPVAGGGEGGLAFGWAGADDATAYIDCGGWGAFAGGYAYGTGGNPALIQARWDGSIAFGGASGGTIQTGDIGGTFAFGYAFSQGTVYARSRGGCAFGYASTLGAVRAGGVGIEAAFALGYAHGSGSYVRATNNGSLAVGLAKSSGDVRATGLGSTAFGYSKTGGAYTEAGGRGCLAFGYSASDGHIIAAGANARGTLAGGHVTGTGSYIFADLRGSVALGAALYGGGIRSRQEGTFCAGDAYGEYALIVSDDRGAVSMGHARQHGMISSSEYGAMARGFVEGIGPALDTQITADSEGAFASGAALSGADMLAFGVGSHCLGECTGSSLISTVAGSHGCLAGGYTSDGASLISLDRGCFAFGRANHDGDAGAVIGAKGDGSFAMGYISCGTNSANARIYANGSGSFAIGRAYNNAAAGALYSSVWATGSGAMAQGFANRVGMILASGGGAHAGGYVDSAHISAGSPATIEATAAGTFAHGLSKRTVTVGAKSYLKAISPGAWAGGYAWGYDAATYAARIEAQNQGSFAHGYARDGFLWAQQDGAHAFGRVLAGSEIAASGLGSFATGNAAGGSKIISSGTGSLASGFADAGFDLFASGDGSFAVGRAQTADVRAGAANSMQFGQGTNLTADTVQIGAAGLRLKQTTGAPGVLQNGDIWVANNYVYIRSNGVSCKCLNANM